MRAEFTDDATDSMKGVGSISLWMPSRDVLELNDVLFVLGLKKNLLSISYMTDFLCRVAFKGHQCTISDCSLVSPRIMARGL